MVITEQTINRPFTKLKLLFHSNATTMIDYLKGIMFLHREMQMREEFEIFYSISLTLSVQAYLYNSYNGVLFI